MPEKLFSGEWGWAGRFFRQLVIGEQNDSGSGNNATEFSIYHIAHHFLSEAFSGIASVAYVSEIIQRIYPHGPNHPYINEHEANTPPDDFVKLPMWIGIGSTWVIFIALIYTTVCTWVIISNGTFRSQSPPEAMDAWM